MGVLPVLGVHGLQGVELLLITLCTGSVGVNRGGVCKFPLRHRVAPALHQSPSTSNHGVGVQRYIRLRAVAVVQSSRIARLNFIASHRARIEASSSHHLFNVLPLVPEMKLSSFDKRSSSHARKSHRTVLRTSFSDSLHALPAPSKSDSCFRNRLAATSSSSASRSQPGPSPQWATVAIAHSPKSTSRS
jgi:hypothetical protein